MEREMGRHEKTEYQLFFKCRFRASHHHMYGRFHFQMSALPTYFTSSHNLFTGGRVCLPGEEELQIHAALRALGSVASLPDLDSQFSH